MNKSKLMLVALLLIAACEGGAKRREQTPVESPPPSEAKSEALTTAPAGNEKGTDSKEAAAEVAAAAEGEPAAAEDAADSVGAREPGKVEPEQKTGAKVAEALLDPSKATLQAPGAYTARLKTTRGDVLIDVTRAWSPNAADRFYNLVRAGYFTDVAFFRVIGGFMAQAGMHGDPRINALWAKQGIPDEKPTQSNTRGMVSFAAAGKDSRSNQFFINFADNSRLDSYPPSGFPPFGKVRRMNVMDRIYAEYGEGSPMGRGPSQGRVAQEGNVYLHAEFPKLDYIKSASIED